MVDFKSGKTRVNREINRLEKDFAVYFKNVNRETARVVQKGAEAILAETIPLTPVETGALRASGRVFVGTAVEGRKFARIRGVVSFGGNIRISRERQVQLGGTGDSRNAPTGFVTYAGIVHERVGLNHPIGQAKYLQAGAARALPKVRRIIREGFKNLAK